MRSLIFISLILLLSFTSQNSYANNGQTTLVLPTDSEIIIDGDNSEWPNTISKVKVGREFFGNDMPDEADFSAFFMTTYSPQSNILYVTLEINDDSHVEGQKSADNWSQQDSVTLYLDPTHSVRGSGSALYLLLGNTQLMNVISSPWDAQTSALDWTNANAKMMREGTTTVYEWRFKLEQPLSEGKTMGFDFLIVDKDEDDPEGQRSLFMWGPFTGKSQSSTRIGDLAFVQPDKQLGNLEGTVAWDSAVETEETFKRVRITENGNPNFWVHTDVDEKGRFSIQLPQGDYEISSAYQVQGSPWTELFIPDRSLSVVAKINPKEITVAKTLLIPRINEPDLVPATGILLSDTKIDAAKLENDIKSYMEYFKVPGASISLIKEGKLAYYNVFGVKNNYTGQAVTNETLFEGASITKAVFAFAVNRLAERGEIDLDKPLYQYLPFKDISHDERYKKITGRHALSHQTGFPNWAWQNEDNKLDIKFYPGSKYGYSGEGFEYLGRVVSHITGKTLEEVIRDEVQIPFNYENNLYFSNAPEVQGNVSHGHYASYAVPVGTPSTIGVAHSMQTEAKSFSQFMLGLLDEKGLSEQGYVNMLEPQIEVPIVPEDGDLPFPQWYGLGFHMTQTPLGLGYGHGGNNGDFTCYFYVYKDLDIGFAIFTNADTGTAFHKKMHEYLVLGEMQVDKQYPLKTKI